MPTVTARAKPHILVVPSWWPSPEQPVNGVFHTDYVRAFSEAGLRVGVVVPDLVSLRFLGRGTRIPFRPRITHEKSGSVPVVRVRALHTALRIPALQMTRFRRWLLAGLAEYTMRHGLPDVIHAMCAIPAGWACTTLGHPLARRVVITDGTGPFSLAMRKRSGDYVHAAMNAAAAVVAVSDLTRRQMQAEAIDRGIIVCGNPISSEFAAGPLPEFQRDPATPVRAAFVGRLTEAKGALDLAHAIAALRGTPDAEWRFIGDGPLMGEIRSRTHAAGVGRRTVLRGHLARDKLRDELAAADFLVLPSHGESFGMVVAEALCMGLPVLTTRGTACAEFVGRDDGMLVNRSDVPGLADALREMIRLARSYDRFGIARRARDRFSPAAVAAWYLDLFERVIATAPAGA